MDKDLDLVIFGATGFSAIYVIEEIGTSKLFESFKWAIAGRNKAKLTETLEAVSKNIGKDLRDVEILIGDVNDEKSLNEICSRTKLLLNCVGPYLLYGEPVIKASIQNGCDYIDLCGEALFLEKMELKYNIQAREANVYIISACGFDSVPTDMGVIYAQQHFQGDLDRIEAYFEYSSEGGHKGSALNYTTFLSVIQLLSGLDQMRAVRRQVMPKPMPKSPFPPPHNPILFKSTDLRVNGWCIPFPGTDESVVQRTQYYFYENENKRPLQFSPYFLSGSLLLALFIMFMGAIVFLMTKTRFTKKLLEKYPKIFTGGAVSRDNPHRSDIEKSSFQWTLVGKGYEEKLNDPQLQHNAPPDKTIIVTVKGRDVYKSTAICFTQVAYTMLKERSHMPAKGGVYTTGATFYKTDLINRLQDRGIQFKVLNHDNN